MHCDIGHYLIPVHTCLGVHSNTEEATHAHPSHSEATFFSFFFFNLFIYYIHRM
jgi:hypothetical protein